MSPYKGSDFPDTTSGIFLGGKSLEIFSVGIAILILIWVIANV